MVKNVIILSVLDQVAVLYGIGFHNLDNAINSGGKLDGWWLIAWHEWVEIGSNLCFVDPDIVSAFVVVTEF